MEHDQQYVEGKRYNLTLNDTILEYAVDGKLVNSFPVEDGPMTSSNPYCPIIDYKVMYDDGTGTPTQEVNPYEVKIEKVNSTHVNLTIETAIAIEKLTSGQKMEYVLIAVTEKG
jgi:hypothetical protein